jgi:hypothetical protein
MECYRAYFNRKREAPQVWSLDEGTQASEVNVIGFQTEPGCTMRSRYNGDKPNDDSPSAWVEIHADYYFIKDGIATFRRWPEDGRS